MIEFRVVDPRADTGVDESENTNHRVVNERNKNHRSGREGFSGRLRMVYIEEIISNITICGFGDSTFKNENRNRRFRCQRLSATGLFFGRRRMFEHGRIRITETADLEKRIARK